MNAVRICVNKEGILYMDEHYQTWIFKIQDGKFLPLEKSIPIAEYIAKQGFLDIDKDTLAILTTHAMTAINGGDLQVNEGFHIDIHVLRDVKEGLNYYNPKNKMPLYDHLLIKPLLCNLEDYDVTKLNEIRYDDEGMYFYSSEDEDFLVLKEVTLLTDKEIDSIKVGDLAEDPEWYLKINTKILCCSIKDGEDSNYLWFFYGYNSESGNLLDDEGNERGNFKNYRPLTDQELDQFKIGI